MLIVCILFLLFFSIYEVSQHFNSFIASPTKKKRPVQCWTKPTRANERSGSWQITATVLAQKIGNLERRELSRPTRQPRRQKTCSSREWVTLLTFTVEREKLLQPSYDLGLFHFRDYKGGYLWSRACLLWKGFSCSRICILSFMALPHLGHWPRRGSWNWGNALDSLPDYVGFIIV